MQDSATSGIKMKSQVPPDGCEPCLGMFAFSSVSEHDPEGYSGGRSGN